MLKAGPGAGHDYSSANPGPVTFDYDAEGKRTAMSDDSGPSDYSYDSLGRLTSHTKGASQTTTYHWNATDQLTSIGYPDAIAAHDAGDPAPDPLAAGTVSRSYDADGRMQSVRDWLGHTTEFAYDADSNLTGVERRNGTSATYSYDAEQQVTGLNDVGLMSRGVGGGAVGCRCRPWRSSPR